MFSVLNLKQANIFCQLTLEVREVYPPQLLTALILLIPFNTLDTHDTRNTIDILDTRDTLDTLDTIYTLDTLDLKF